jgi:hypothetical protein
MLFHYLTDLANFKNLLPDDIEEFSVKEDSFKFALKGMPAIRLAITDKREYDLIRLQATSEKMPVTLLCRIEPIDDAQARVQLFFEAAVNPMMAMMIKKPLQNLLHTLAKKMGEQ